MASSSVMFGQLLKGFDGSLLLCLSSHERILAPEGGPKWHVKIELACSMSVFARRYRDGTRNGQTSFAMALEMALDAVSLAENLPEKSRKASQRIPARSSLRRFSLAVSAARRGGLRTTAHRKPTGNLPGKAAGNDATPRSWLRHPPSIETSARSDTSDETGR
jgi:hypothetical protein